MIFSRRSSFTHGKMAQRGCTHFVTHPIFKMPPEFVGIHQNVSLYLSLSCSFCFFFPQLHECVQHDVKNSGTFFQATNPLGHNPRRGVVSTAGV